MSDDEEFSRLNEAFDNDAYIHVATAIRRAVSAGNIEEIEKLNTHLARIYDDKDKKYLYNCCIDYTSLVILACKSNQTEMVQYLYSLNLSLNKTSEDIFSPCHLDEENHNAFYYALRSNDVQLLDALLSGASDTGSLRVLAEAFEELKLKNVPLCEEMELCVARKLATYTLLSKRRETEEYSRLDSRRKLIINNISILVSEYVSKAVDSRFLYLTKVIAHHVHILRQLLNWRNSWEHLDVCLVRFISSHMKQQDKNIIYRYVLTKQKIIKYLLFFLEILVENEYKNICDNDVVKELSDDYWQVQEVDTIERMRFCAEILVKESEEEAINRALEQLRRCLRLEALSPSLRDLLGLAAPHYLFRTKLPPITQIQQDFKQFAFLVTYINFSKYFTIVNAFLEKMINGECLEEMDRVFHAVQFEDIISDAEKHQDIQVLFQQLKTAILANTLLDQSSLKVIDNMINFPKTDLDTLPVNYCMIIGAILNYYPTRRHTLNLKIQKYDIEKTLKNITLTQKPPNFACIIQVSKVAIEGASKLRQKVEGDLEDDIAFLEVKDLFFKVCFIASYETRDNEYFKVFMSVFHVDKCSLDYFELKLLDFSLNPNCGNNEINNLKMSKLRNLLSKTDFTKKLLVKSSVLTAVEMLVLDILSLLCKSDGLLLLDLPCALVSGEVLRRYLLLSSPVLDLSAVHSNIALIAIAYQVAQENMVHDRRHSLYISSLEEKHYKDLFIITNQQGMFTAAEEGNLTELENSVSAGADLHARDIHMWTVLHYAAKGNSIPVLQFILSHTVNKHAKNDQGECPLHIAAALGQINSLEHLLLAGLPVDAPDNDQRTPLHLAALYGRDNIVITLLKHNACPSAMDILTLTPLHYSVKNNHPNIVNILLKYESHADTNKVMGGCTFLMMAAEHGYRDLTELFLQSGADINHMNDSGWTPLHIAAHNGHEMVVHYLLTHGALLNATTSDNCTPLYYAIFSGHNRIVKILLEHEADVNTAERSSQCSPLHRAAANGQCELVDLLLQHGAHVGAQTLEGLTPLHMACRLGHLEIVQSLRLHKASILSCDCQGRTALHHASDSGHMHIIQYLFEMGASVDAIDHHKLTPLHLAAKIGKKDVLEFLIAKGATVNVKDEDYCTPLHFSAQESHINVTEVLLKNGAYIDSKNKNKCTALHLAAEKSSVEIVEFLLLAGASFNIADNSDFQPIHLAAIRGNQGIIQALIRGGASPNSLTSTNHTPLHLAAAMGNKMVINLLIQEGAPISTTNNEGLNALCLAIQNNHKEAVQTLLKNGSDINFEKGLPLLSAISNSNTSMVDVLLTHEQIRLNVIAPSGGCSPLHSAAKNGNLKIVKKLIERGANVDLSSDDRLTPLHLASIEGHVEIVKLLLDKGARVGCVGYGGLTPLHIAASSGHVDIVSLLLARGAQNHRTNTKNTPLGVAAGFGHVAVAKILIQNDPSLVNSQENSTGTALHIAALEGHLEMCKYLVHIGFNIKCSNGEGSKPIHLASREGHLQIVEYLLSHGCGVHDKCGARRTPLHYAARGGSVPMATFLLNVGSNINAFDHNRLTPLHVAALNNHLDLIKFLLSRGAAYDIVDSLHRKPCEVTKDDKIQKILQATEILFEMVKRNNPTELKGHLEAGAPVEARNREGLGPLHVACQQGKLSTVQVLLGHGANADAVDSAGNTSLHHACLSSNFKVVRTLLIHGAVYNSTNMKNQTPLHFSEKREIIDLFNKVYQVFKNVKNGQIKVINFLNNIKDIDTMKAIMYSHNVEGKTLLVVAIQNDFPMIDKLKEILQCNLTHDMELVDVLQKEEKHREAMNTLQRILQNSWETLGTNNSITWETQKKVASILYKNANYAEALRLFRQVYQKQIEILGPDNEDSLDTSVKLALTLYGMCENVEALSIFRIVYEKQKELLGATHPSTLNTLCHTGLVLDRLQQFQEALDAYSTVLAADHPSHLIIRNNIATIYLKQGKYQESLDTFQDVYRASCEIHGPDHSDTLRILQNQATVLAHQNKPDDALATLQEVFAKQQIALGPGHVDTLASQSNIGDIYFIKGNWIAAYKYYKESFAKRKNIFGAQCPDILDTQSKMEIIKIRLQIEDNIDLNDFEPLENNIHTAATVGNIKIIEDLLECGTNPNIRDKAGRTPLHYAVFGDHLELVTYLLNRGADATITTNKGNTPLHTAAFKGNIQIVESLLEHIKQKKNKRQIFFINATTTSTGATALHVAAKEGFLSVVECLLNFGAVYNPTNKNKQTPLDLSTNEDISRILRTVDQLFKDTRSGKIDSVNCLREGEVSVVMNARNDQDQTPLQVALSNRHKDIAKLLAHKLRSSK